MPNSFSGTKRTKTNAAAAHSKLVAVDRGARLCRHCSGSALALVAVCGAALWALQSNQKRETRSDELYSTDHNKIADGLAGLPKDYAGIPREAPRLGPPLPGDLGRPIVAAQTQSGPLAIDAEQQRVNQESEAARTSRIFAATSARAPAATAPLSEPSGNGAATSDEASAQTENWRSSMLRSIVAPRATIGL
jgi:type IV secretion system protein TrbI